MKWEFSSDRSISAQIVEAIQRGVLSGVYPPGSSMPSVRALALEAGVNPNTMQKALVDLENQGLLHTQRTSGRTVTSDERLIMELKERMAQDYITQFFEGMSALGIGRAEAAELLLSKAQLPFPADTTIDTKEVN
ncbi:MAG: GntR family transcriptional regulator [Eggerthellaceae bacterium]|nr:GntR family transcriptional regulator [Eggerthellaceae bacterium]